VLSADESAHLVSVRRVRVGDAVVLFDGRGGTALCRLVEAAPRAALVRVEGPYPDREPERAVVLAVSPPEAGRLDVLVSGLAELGVSRLIPLLAERTPAGRGDLVLGRQSRFTRLALDAAKVNGRSRLLEVSPPAALERLLGESGPGLVLLDPDPGLPPLPDCLPASGPLPWLLVGPEGGFTESELERGKRAGGRLARLGHVALRTGTAALAAAAVALAT
jgi:16S rRNA (uracil1498-N3)-methyltransferase